MKSTSCASILLLAVTLVGCERERTNHALAPAQQAQAQSEAPAEDILGAPPVCEPSAAVAVDEGRVLVADNELKGALYAYRADASGRLVEQQAWPMPSKKRPRDIEALTWLDDDRSALLVVGSHSRSWQCEPRPKRMRMRVLRRDGDRLSHDRLIDTSERWASATASASACRAELVIGAAPHADAICARLAQVEAAARVGEPDSCGVVNIEGAVRVEGRIWLGLRSPLVEGRAVLLRLTPELDTLRFDDARLVDLDGRGVRELATHDGHLYLIAGPPLDADAPFQLWRLPGSDLDATPERLAELPSSSEGLAWTPGGLVALIDGSEGDDDACEEPARQHRVK